jgi:hypothetical protein
VTGPAHWEKWVVALGRCGNERRDKIIIIIIIYRLTVENLIKGSKRIYKKVSNIQNLIFK